MSFLSAAVARISSGANHMVQVAVTALASVFVDLGLFVLMLFFLLRDGEDLREALRGISPLTRGQEVELTDHLTRTVKGVLMSMVVVPVCQGLVALPAFWALRRAQAAPVEPDGRLRGGDPAGGLAAGLGAGGAVPAPQRIHRPGGRPADLRRRRHQRHRQRHQAGHPARAPRRST